MADQLTGEVTELLQQLIRNQCVNDGSPESGEEARSADLLRDYLEGTGMDMGSFDSLPGRRSLVARIEGSDPNAPSLCLMGHTDVVPVTPSGWSRDPFGGELVDGEVWGRGAIDMLNLTASMAVATKHLAALRVSSEGHPALLRRRRRGSRWPLGSRVGPRPRTRRRRRGLRDHRVRRAGHGHPGRPEGHDHGRRERRDVAPAARPRHARARLGPVRCRQRTRQGGRGRAPHRGVRAARRRSSTSGRTTSTRSTSPTPSARHSATPTPSSRRAARFPTRASRSSRTPARTRRSRRMSRMAA